MGLCKKTLFSIPHSIISNYVLPYCSLCILKITRHHEHGSKGGVNAAKGQADVKMLCPLARQQKSKNYLHVKCWQTSFNHDSCPWCSFSHTILYLPLWWVSHTPWLWIRFSIHWNVYLFPCHANIHSIMGYLMSKPTP